MDEIVFFLSTESPTCIDLNFAVAIFRYTVLPLHLSGTSGIGFVSAVGVVAVSYTLTAVPFCPS